MEKGEILNRAKETLSPFETKNIAEFVKGLTIKGAMENPWIIAILLIVFFAIIKRSKFVLLTLFAAISLMLLFRFTFPAPGDQLAMSSTLPFVFGGLVIGGVVIYFSFIKSD